MSLPFDWFILLLRVLFVFLLYFFLFQIVRTIARELRALSIATAGGPAPRAAAPSPAVQLVLLEPTESGYPAGHRFPVRSGAAVGRRDGVAIQLNDTYISSEHARIFLNDGRWWVSDMGSTNGTFVNNVRIDRPTILVPGVEVRFGRIRMQFVA
ncbi:MAG: FHA domain-containing protein [Chloroflexia bacterium]